MVFGLLSGGDDVSPCFSLEWYDGYGSIIFYDENWSEYRGVDKDHPVEIGDDVRVKIAHGELSPHPMQECMMAPRAFDAAIDFLKTGSRPSWISYTFIS